MKSQQRTTTVVGFNMNGTLNKPSGDRRPVAKIPVIKYPRHLLDVTRLDANYNQSQTTMILTFDKGWAVSMRIHNKDKYIRPGGLAWDVQLVGFPLTTYSDTRPWDE